MNMNLGINIYHDKDDKNCEICNTKATRYFQHIKTKKHIYNREQIVNKNWSLKYEDYIEKVDNTIDNDVNGILYKPLGDVCKFICGKFNTQDYDKLKVNTDEGIDFYCGQYNSPIGKIKEKTFKK